MVTTAHIFQQMAATTQAGAPHRAPTNLRQTARTPSGNNETLIGAYSTMTPGRGSKQHLEGPLANLTWLNVNLGHARVHAHAQAPAQAHAHAHAHAPLRAHAHTHTHTRTHTRAHMRMRTRACARACEHPWAKRTLRKSLGHAHARTSTGSFTWEMHSISISLHYIWVAWRSAGIALCLHCACCVACCSHLQLKGRRHQRRCHS